MSTAPLVDNDDTDLANWQAGDQSTFLEMVCAEVRKYCGWHVAPSVTVTNLRCWFGAREFIMLPSTYVTDVSSVTVDDHVLHPDHEYTWDEPHPWLRHRLAYWPRERFARVSFTHGYPETPPDMKAVVFEVLATAMELPASNATNVQTMQYNITLNTSDNGAKGTAALAGVSLSDNQKNRLGKYRIHKFGGLSVPLAPEGPRRLP